MLKQLKLSLQFALEKGSPASARESTRHRQALPRHLVAKWIRHALQDDAEITVRIVGAAEGQALNRDYRHKDYATNVLTFDYAKPPNSPVVQADLVVCAPVIAAEARAQKKTLQAHYAHLLVHGSLHAQGWDHETSDADARAMESLEVDILNKLGFKNPY